MISPEITITFMKSFNPKFAYVYRFTVLMANTLTASINMSKMSFVAKVAQSRKPGMT